MAIEKVPQSLEEVFSGLEKIEGDVLSLFESHTSSSSTFYNANLVLWGVGNRTISQCRGFASMLRDRNFSCSSAILRMQLDTVLRLYAGFLYGHIGEYAEKIFAGAVISTLRSKSGKRLYDRFLVKELAKQQPWIKPVYENCSGSIHLSQRHIMLALGEVSDDGSIQMQIGPSDRHVDEQLFLELGQAFLHTTVLSIQMIDEWHMAIPRAAGQEN